jgi:hypothetical protein
VVLGSGVLLQVQAPMLAVSSSTLPVAAVITAAIKPAGPPSLVAVMRMRLLPGLSVTVEVPGTCQLFMVLRSMPLTYRDP